MKRISMRASAGAAAALWLLAIAGCGKKHHTARTQPAPKPSTEAGAPSTRERAASLPPPNVPKRAMRPAPLPSGYTEEGVASWYGIPFHGRAAADGEIYDMDTLVAAHRLMPFNTWLRVTNLSNDKSVEVRIIDRGPFVDGRIIDLSRAAARAIDMIGPGTARVRLEVIAAPADIPANDFYAVQVGAFSVYANAEHVRSEYAQRFGVAQLALRQGKVQMWRVLVGKESSVQAAQQLAATLTAENKEVFVVRLDETVINAGTIAPAPTNVPPGNAAPEPPAQAPVPPK